MFFCEKSRKSRDRRYRLRSKTTMNYISLGKSLIFTEPNIPHLQNGDSSTSYFLTDFPEAQMIKDREGPQGCKAAVVSRWSLVESRGQPSGRAGLSPGIAASAGGRGQDNAQMGAETYRPGRIAFQSPAAGCLLFLFPSGKEGSIRPWKTDPVCRSGNQNTFLKFCNSIAFGKCFAI